MIVKQNSFLMNLNSNNELIKVVDFTINKTKERFSVKRVQLRLQLLLKDIFNWFHKNGNSDDSDKTVKKSVRIDNDMFEALLKKKAVDNKAILTKTVNSAIMSEISTGQIDLIVARWFKHKITIYFTQEEYKCIEQVIFELKLRGFKNITFSSLVRSILYKKLELIAEAELAIVA